MFDGQRQPDSVGCLPVQRGIGQPFRRRVDLVSIADGFGARADNPVKCISLVGPADIALERQRIRDVEGGCRFHADMARRAIRHIEAIAVAEEEVFLVHPVGSDIEDEPPACRTAARADLHTVQRLGLHLARHLQVLQAVEVRHLRRPLATRIVHVIAHVARRPDQAEFRRQQVKAVRAIGGHIEAAVDAGGGIGRIIILVRFAPQTRQNADIVAEAPFRFAPHGQRGRVDRVVIVDPLRESRVAREKAERVRLDFLQIATRHIHIGADTQIQHVARLPAIAYHQAAAGVSILFDAAIRQEVL